MKIVQQEDPESGCPGFDLTRRQTIIAFECLEKALAKYHHEPPARSLTEDLLPYLIHATVLFFINRDQRAFETIFTSPAYDKLGLGGRLRQLPTLNQLQAVLNSRKTDPAWQTLCESEQELIAGLQMWTDEALDVQALKSFRDQLLINGVPPAGEVIDTPFSMPGVDYIALCNEALSGWKRLTARPD